MEKTNVFERKSVENSIEYWENRFLGIGISNIHANLQKFLNCSRVLSIANTNNLSSFQGPRSR